MSQTTVVDWKMFLRDICAEYFIVHPVQLGGPGRVVEIYESVFSRRKYNCGRAVREQWVFGGIDVVIPQGFLIAVPRRNTDTLLPIIQQYILPGTTIISDTGAHTNNVENMWMRAKQRSKRERGTHRHLLQSYMTEFVWRNVMGCDPFENIIWHT